MIRGILFFIFTLIVTLGLLAGTVALGFNILKRRDELGRDNARNAVGLAVNIELNNFFIQNSRFPEKIEIFDKLRFDDIEVDTQLEISKLTRFQANEDLTSTEIGTIYCYQNLGNKYAFGVKFESGQWRNFGDEPCGDDNVI